MSRLISVHSTPTQLHGPSVAYADNAGVTRRRGASSRADAETRHLSGASQHPISQLLKTPIIEPQSFLQARVLPVRVAAQLAQGLDNDVGCPVWISRLRPDVGDIS